MAQLAPSWFQNAPYSRDCRRAARILLRRPADVAMHRIASHLRARRRDWGGWLRTAAQCAARLQRSQRPTIAARRCGVAHGEMQALENLAVGKGSLRGMRMQGPHWRRGWHSWSRATAVTCCTAGSFREPACNGAVGRSAAGCSELAHSLLLRPATTAVLCAVRRIYAYCGTYTEGHGHYGPTDTG